MTPHQNPRYVNRLYQPRRNDHVVDRDDRYRDDPIRRLRLKIEIPEFTGKVHPDNFIDWLSTVERVFDVRDIPEKLKVKLISHQASITCFVMNMTVEEGIADIVSLQPYWTYTDVCRLALKVEKRIKAKSKGSTGRFTPPTRTAPPKAPKATSPTTSFAGNNIERVYNTPLCYKCSRLGHYARDCPNLKTLVFVPDDAGPIYDTDAEPKLDEPCDELLYPDRGEALVI
ncbi:reverse transcriptase domain-containing protein [Tanacetum coccineum]